MTMFKTPCMPTTSCLCLPAPHPTRGKEGRDHKRAKRSVHSQGTPALVVPASDYFINGNVIWDDQGQVGAESLAPFPACLGGEGLPSNLRAEDWCGEGTQPGDTPLSWGLVRVEAEARQKPILKRDWQTSLLEQNFPRREAGGRMGLEQSHSHQRTTDSQPRGP